MAQTARLCIGNREAVRRAQRFRRLNCLPPPFSAASKAPLHEKVIRCDAVRGSGADVQSRRHGCKAAILSHRGRTLQSLQRSEGAATATGDRSSASRSSSLVQQGKGRACVSASTSAKTEDADRAQHGPRHDGPPRLQAAVTRACTRQQRARAVPQRISLKTLRERVNGCKSAIEARNVRVCPHRARAASSRRHVEAGGSCTAMYGGGCCAAICRRECFCGRLTGW